MRKLILIIILLLSLPIVVAPTQDAEIVFGDSGAAANGVMATQGNISLTTVYFLEGQTVRGAVGAALVAIRGWIEEILIANIQDFT